MIWHFLQQVFTTLLNYIFFVLFIPRIIIIIFYLVFFLYVIVSGIFLLDYSFHMFQFAWTLVIYIVLLYDICNQVAVTRKQ